MKPPNDIIVTRGMTPENKLKHKKYKSISALIIRNQFKSNLIYMQKKSTKLWLHRNRPGSGYNKSDSHLKSM
jgi:hypothetical protein